MPDNLAKRSINSVTWNSISSLAQIVLGFVQFTILTRLIDPVVFGVYAQVSATVMLLGVLPGFGMQASYLHRSKYSEDLELATAIHFTIKLIFTVLWAGLLLAAVYLLGGLTDPDQRTAYLAIVASEAVIQISQSPRLMLIRKVQHQRLALLDLFNIALTSIIASLMAFFGATLWALLISNIVEAAVNVLLLFVWRPVWRPKLKWSWPAVRYFLGFGATNLAGRGLQMALDRLDDIWTGTYLGKEALGFYSRAYKFAKYPSSIIATPVTDVAAGTYAELKGDRENLSLAFARTNALMVRTGFFMAGVLSLIAPEFIVIVMGARWLPVLDAFRLMLIFTLFDPMKQTIASLFVAVGQPMTVVKVRIFQLAVMIGGMYLLGQGLGIAGVALAVDVMLVLGITLVLWLAKKYVDISIKDMMLAPMIGVAAGLGLALGVEALLPKVNALLLSALIDTALFSIGYAAVLLLLDRQNTRDLIFLLNKYLIPKKYRRLFAKETSR